MVLAEIIRSSNEGQAVAPAKALRRIATAPRPDSQRNTPWYTLVYFEVHDEMHEAIQREKRLKKWNRAWKIRLIEEMNPEWKDLTSQAF